MIIELPQKRCLARAVAVTVACLSMAACTYGPEQRRATIEQVVRAGDTYTAYVLVQSEVFRRPTGINTFPNGGVSRFVSRVVKVYEVQAREQKARLLAELPADEGTWESYSGHISGLDDRNGLYLQLGGCKKGGECHPALYNYRYFHLGAEGALQPLPALPPETALPGTMLARRQGEVNYVRFSVRRDTLKARFRENGAYHSLFAADDEGNLFPVH